HRPITNPAFVPNAPTPPSPPKQFPVATSSRSARSGAVRTDGPRVDLWLDTAPRNTAERLDVVRIVRALSKQTLFAVMERIDAAPGQVALAVDPSDADRARNEIVAMGLTARIEPAK